MYTNKMIKSINSTVIVLCKYIGKRNVRKHYNYSSLVHLPIKENKHATFFQPLIRLISKIAASKKLQELLNVNAYRASCMVSNHTNLTKLSTEELEKNYHFCLENGLSKETLLAYPNILSDTALIPKVRNLKLLPYDINVSAPLLLIPLKRFMGFLNEELAVKRIEEYKNLFQVDVSDVCKWISTKSFLTSININNVKENVHILLDAGVTLQAIINDLWVLRYSPGVIDDRIKLAKQNNIEVIKTWMVRAQKEIFDNYVRRRSDTKEILGDKHDLVEYLSEKLECSLEVSKFLISKQPALQKKSLRKMSGMIDFLLLYGFKPIQICRSPKIMLHSVETIRKRLRELETSNIQLDSLHILTKSQRQYMSFIDSMKANKGK
ncbi:unnamed protein product, partial [Psylliodes chrysocephalus]